MTIHADTGHERSYRTSLENGATELTRYPVTFEHELLAISTTAPEARRILVFAPHPDDEIFGCGGLLQLYVHQGAACRGIMITSGDFGPHGEVGAAVREQESRTAAEVIGYDDIRYWREPDRGVSYNERLIVMAGKELEAFQPDLVLSPWPGERHPDHRATAWTVIEAVRRYNAGVGTAIRVAMYEISAPLAHPNLLVDISPVLDGKAKAMACFGSQLALQPYDRQIGALNRYRSITLAAGVEAAEAYWLLEPGELSNPSLLAEPTLFRHRRLGVDDPVAGEKVSVLVRSMNRPTLGRSLDSIALQSYPNIEVVVLNAGGGLHQPLSENCGRYPLLFLDSDTPVPRSCAANRLLDTVTGDYAIFLDDDDWFQPDHVARLAQAIRQDAQAPAAATGVEYGRLNDDRWQVEHVFNGEYNPERLLMENYLPIHAVLLRVPLVRQAGCRFDEARSLYEDWDFWLQLSEIGPFLHAAGVSACYCQSQDGSGAEQEGERQARERAGLLQKWHQRLSVERYDAFLRFAQQQYRLAGALPDLHAQASTAQEFISSLQELLAAREAENAGWRQRSSDLEQIIAAREADIAAREAEIAGWRQRSADLEQIIAARNEEITNLQQRLKQVECTHQRCPLRRQDTN